MQNTLEMKIGSTSGISSATASFSCGCGISGKSSITLSALSACRIGCLPTTVSDTAYILRTLTQPHILVHSPASYRIRVRVRVGLRLPRLIVELGEVPLFHILLAALSPTSAVTSCCTQPKAVTTHSRWSGVQSSGMCFSTSCLIAFSCQQQVSATHFARSNGAPQQPQWQLWESSPCKHRLGLLCP